VGHSQGKQSASLGRATAGGMVAVRSGTSESGGGSVLRWTSSDDMNIPARISKARVGLRIRRHWVWLRSLQ